MVQELGTTLKAQVNSLGNQLSKANAENGELRSQLDKLRAASSRSRCGSARNGFERVFFFFV